MKFGLNTSSATDSSAEFADVRSLDVVHAFRDLLDLHPETVLFKWRDNKQEKSLTRGEVKRAVLALSDRLTELGFQPGDRVALISESRPEWCIAFLAIVKAGLVVVPVDVKATEAEIASLLSHAQPRLIFISRDCAAQWPALAAPAAAKVEIVNPMDGGGLTHVPADYVEKHHHSSGSSDAPAVLAYTSGTSGSPKGVMLTMKNLWFEVRSLSLAFDFGRHDVMLSILPLNHMLELTGGILSAMFTRSQIVFANTLLPNEILDLAARHGVTQMVTVPQFLEHMHRGILRGIERQGRLARFFVGCCLRVAPHIPSFEWRRRIFAGIHGKLGGQLRAFIVGGAALRPEVGNFFQTIGVHVFQGYGLTETSPVATVNRRKENRIGSVGRPLPGVRIRIETERPEDAFGEILVRGPNVMVGYYKNRQATEDAIDRDGWFHTGDVGYLDGQGYLWITGRKKNLIVTMGGKKVLPDEVEEPLGRHENLAELCVMGIKATTGPSAGSEQVVAVIRPNETWRDLDDETLLRRFESDAIALLEPVAAYKRPARYLVYRKEFPKTSTRKIKRRELIEKLREEGYL